MKLKGKAKADFLARMAKGRKKAAAARRRNPDRFEEQQRFETEQYMRSKLGRSYGRRRKPRVRRVKGRAGMFQCVTEDKRTDRAAFRAARQLRDQGGEKRPLKVLKKARPPKRKIAPRCAAVRRKKAPRRRKNPQLLTVLGNPVRAEMAKAVAAYRRFHGVAPKKMSRGGGKGVLIALGELREIVYQPRRGERRGPAFAHAFKAGNVLAVTPDGKKLVIVDRKRRKAVDFDLGIVS